MVDILMSKGIRLDLGFQGLGFRSWVRGLKLRRSDLMFRALGVLGRESVEVLAYVSSG